MKILALIGSIVVLSSLVACSNNVASAQIGNPEQGREIYETGGDAGIPCKSCHSLDGTTVVGPGWAGLDERAAERIAGVAAEDYLRQSITAPSAYVVEGYADIMPKDFAERLSDEQINDVIAFMLSLE